MLTFFRKTRKGLLTESRFSKYALYALGEIILVMIGILLALQVNNYNEKRISDAKTKNYLQSFSKELSNNKIRLERALANAHEDLLITKQVLEDVNDEINPIDNDYMYHTKLVPVFKIDLEHSVFQDMINSGVLENFKNEEVKTKIFQFSVLKSDYDESYEDAADIWDNYMLPYFNEHLNVTNLWDSLRGVPMPKLKFKNNLKAFSQNKKFSNILASRMRMLANLESRTSRAIGQIEVLIENINDYLLND